MYIIFTIRTHKKIQKNQNVFGTPLCLKVDSLVQHNLKVKPTNRTDLN